MSVTKEHILPELINTLNKTNMTRLITTINSSSVTSYYNTNFSSNTLVNILSGEMLDNAIIHIVSRFTITKMRLLIKYITFC